jgi:tetratricopeptide (TPR) repeat protein
MDSYNIAKQHGLTSRMAKALNNMGIVYMHLKDYDRALATCQEALTLNKQLNNVEETGSNLANCGLVTSGGRVEEHIEEQGIDVAYHREGGFAEVK